MHSTTYERWLTHPPQIAWAFLSDPVHDPIWRREILSVEPSSDGASPGCAYRERVAWEGVVAEVNMFIRESIKGSTFTVVAEDPGYCSISEWSFSPKDGGTLVRLNFSLEASGPLRLVEPFMWAILNRWLERDLDTLEQHLDEFAQNTGHKASP